MQTISIFQWVAAAANRQPIQQKRTKGTRSLVPLLASIMLLLGVFSASAQVSRTVGTLPPGGTVTITFDVTINTPFPANTASVTNQGSVSASGIATILTDDPAVGGASDPTVTTVFVAPQITCPADITTNGFGACLPAVPFSATVTAGVPAPTLSYKLGATVITSPYVFPAGTNLVTVTATNGTAPNATCTFNVIALAGAAPQLNILGSGTNVVVSWTNLYPCYTLQYATEPATNSWTNYPGPFTTNAGSVSTTNGLDVTKRFFRLSP